MKKLISLDLIDKKIGGGLLLNPSSFFHVNTGENPSVFLCV